MGFAIGSILTTAANLALGKLFGTGPSQVGPGAAATLAGPGPGFSVTAGGQVVRTGSPEQRALEPFADPFARARGLTGPAAFGVTRRRAAFGAVVPLGLAAGRLAVSAATRAKALLLSRELGIAAAATALGLSAIEVAEIITSKRRRRRRGITAAQIATTKATIRRIDSLNRQIASVCPPPARRRRSVAARHHAK